MMNQGRTATPDQVRTFNPVEFDYRGTTAKINTHQRLAAHPRMKRDRSATPLLHREDMELLIVNET
jgi:hypothetical protein